MRPTHRQRHRQTARGHVTLPAACAAGGSGNAGPGAQCGTGCRVARHSARPPAACGPRQCRHAWTASRQRPPRAAGSDPAARHPWAARWRAWGGGATRTPAHPPAMARPARCPPPVRGSPPPPTCRPARWQTPPPRAPAAVAAHWWCRHHPSHYHRVNVHRHRRRHRRQTRPLHPTRCLVAQTVVLAAQRCQTRCPSCPRRHPAPCQTTQPSPRRRSSADQLPQPATPPRCPPMPPQSVSPGQAARHHCHAAAVTPAGRGRGPPRRCRRVAALQSRCRHHRRRRRCCCPLDARGCACKRHR